jgi:hypothetical protein
MSHVGEGSLQAYLDGEIDGPAAAGVRDHVATCAFCAAELTALRQAGEAMHAALALLDAPAPMLRARAAIAAETRQEAGRAATPPRRHSALRLGGWGLAKAAMLLLALAGASAAAIPDVRRALESTLARVAELFGGGPDDVAVPAPPPPPVIEQPAAAEREVRQAFVQPAAGRLRIVLAGAAGPIEVRVRLIDGSRADVQTATDGQVRFVSSTGRLEVAGMREGVVTIGIPRTVAEAAVEIGSARVVKEGRDLVLTGPGLSQRGSEVRFVTGP